MTDSDENLGELSIVGVSFNLSDIEEQVASLNAKIQILRGENTWLREEIGRLQDLAFDRAVQIASLKSDIEVDE
jgi:peptidoglycan hydrolase CwlO-like protein